MATFILKRHDIKNVDLNECGDTNSKTIKRSSLKESMIRKKTWQTHLFFFVFLQNIVFLLKNTYFCWP